ncbi:MAG: hypothetical protein HQ515_03925 [Phycisphaeraceae bacterium]|nr:hypothetical protein [Phycisphaeraceae bacterium]
MRCKQLLCLTVVIVGWCGFVQAQDLIQINDIQTWANFGEGGFDAGDTLQILAGGDLTVSSRSAIKSGMHVMVEDGGAFTINDRLDLDEDGVITLNGGTFTCNGNFMFPDNATGMACHVWLHGGLMFCAQTESRRDRGSTLHLGAGVFQTGNVTEGGRDDPADTEHWNIVAIPPYANVVITELEGSVKEVSAAGTLIQVIDEQVWDDFETAGFGAGDRLEILAGGNLTVNGRSAIKDGMELVVEAGGVFTVNDRMDIDGDGVITMNGGEFYSNVILMFPDNETGLESHIWLYGGLMVCNRIESRADRGSTLHVGEGILRTGRVSESTRYDPSNSETWNIVGIPPLGVVINELEGDVKEVTASGGFIQISDAQIWDDFETGGFTAAMTLQIVDGGTLEVNGRSAIKDGMHLIVEDGGVFRINDRLDVDGDGVITINGGEFHSTVDMKFPDNETGLESHIWLNAGLMACNRIDSRADRGSTLYLGAGMLRTGETYDIPEPNDPIDPNEIEPKLTDPNNIEAWNIVPVDPNTTTLVTTLPNGYKMVTAPRNLIQISDAQVWDTFADANVAAGDTLQILSGGSLEINARSAIKDGMHLIVEEGGVCIFNARVDMDNRGQIILNGGELYSHVDFKFPDNSGHQDVDIWLDAGRMVCNFLESRADRGSTLHVGGGVLTLAQATGELTDPTNVNSWDIVLIPPYTEIVITESDDEKTVLALLPEEQTSDN